MAKRAGLFFWLVLGFLIACGWLAQPGIAEEYCPGSCSIARSVPYQLYGVGPAVISSYGATCTASYLCAADDSMCSDGLGVMGPGTFSASWTGLPSDIITSISLEIRMRCVSNVYTAYDMDNLPTPFVFAGAISCNSGTSTIVTVSNSSSSAQVATVSVNDATLYIYNLSSSINPSGGAYSVTITNSENYAWNGGSYLGFKSLLIDYVLLNITTCACSAVGACCDGCNFRPSGYGCGTQTCPSVSYYNASGSCHKISYTEASCTKTCDASGNCNDCCVSQDTVQDWTCGTCQQRNAASCSGSTGPLCENSPAGMLCTDDGSSCTNDVCYAGTCTHPAICSGTDTSCGCSSCSNCNSQDGYYDTGATQWISAGECTEKQQKQQAYRNYYCSGTSCSYTSGSIQWVDTGSTRNKADGTSCTTALSQPGACSAGTCIPKPLLTVSAAVTPSGINVGESATLSGVVMCLNADCGTVYVFPKGGLLNQPLNEVAGLSVACIPGNVNCYYSCQTMAAGQTCYPSWASKGINKGTYPMFLNVISQTVSALSNQSSAVSLSVTEIPAGTVAMTLSASPAIVAAGSSSVMSAYVSCTGVSTAQCGNVTSYLSSTPSGLSVSPTGPQKPVSCTGLKAGQSCSANWTAGTSAQGVYYLYAVADSDNPNVTNATGNAVLNVTDRPVIQITNISLPSQIKLGETASLSAHIICQSNAFACGTVTASLRYNGTTGLTIQNPEKECGSMAPSSVCPVSWSITGNTAAAYRLEISANSSSSLVVNASAARVLAVSKNLGSLSVSAANPAKIDLKTSLTNSTTLSAVINCSTDYCGSVNVTLWSEGVLLSHSTTVSVQQNQQACSSFPCSREWTLKSSSEGSYQITILAKSNESIEASSSPTLVVEGYYPLLGLASNLAEIKDSRAGQPVQINATISCHTKSCGQVTVSLARDSGGWSNLPSGSAYFVPYSQQNPVIISSMAAGQSSEVSWTVNFAEPGSYIIGIFANGSTENVTNAYLTENISVSSVVGNVEILSPAENQKFSRGDDVSLKALVTADGKPLTGLSAFVSQLGGVTLHDAGNGIYEGSGKVPHDASGQYDLVFRAGEYEASTYISVDPTLSVTANTGKQSYGWGENITVTGEVRKSGILAAAAIHMEVFLMDKMQDEATFASSGTYSYSYQNRFLVEDESGLTIKVTATDQYGNNGEGSAEAVLQAFQGDSLNVSFSMQKANWSRGESMPISVKVTEMGSFREGLDVKCRFKGVDITLEETGGEYRGNYDIPAESETGSLPLRCFVEHPMPGESSTEISIEPMDLKISVVSPKMLPNNIMYVFSENFTVLTVEVRYPNGTAVTDAVLQVTVGGKTTNMTHAGGGSYTANVMFSGSGISDMVFSAQDPRGNRGDSNISLVVNPSQFEWWWLLLIPLGMGILFALWIYKKSKEPPKVEIQEKIIRLPTVERVREVIYRPVRMPQAARPRQDPLDRLRDEISRLEEKSRTTQEAKELAEQQYYKRQIDEATFNKLMQDYEEKLIEIYAALKQKRKELSGA
jgi:hypothetical protein